MPEELLVSREFVYGTNTNDLDTSLTVTGNQFLIGYTLLSR